MARYIGVDLHRNQFTVCVIAENGREYLSEYRLEHLARFVAKLRPTDEVAVEVTGNTRLFYDAVAPHVAKVVVVNPTQFRVIRDSVKKTDPHDARTLAFYLSKEMLPEVRMKDKLHAQLASLTQTRDTLVKQRTALKNKVNNILSAHGINLRKEALSGDSGLEEVLGMKFDAIVMTELRVIVGQIRACNTSIAELEASRPRESTEHQGHWQPGGDRNVVGDRRHQRLRPAGKLAAYFGIVPRVRNSNETERSGRITKRGAKLARTTLVQCSLIAMRYSPYLAKFYHKIQARRGTGKAIIALAKKFLGVIYNTLKNNWIFADFPNFVLAEAS